MVALVNSAQRIRNPHFDDGLVVWRDEYSGRYQAPPAGYGEEFDLQWKIALGGDESYLAFEGVNTGDGYIDDRVYEWTGRHPSGRNEFNYPNSFGVLDHPLDPALIRDKECIDVCCGMGRWTRAMLRIGASSVLSIDMSQHGLESTKRYNPNVRRVDVMKLPGEHPDLVGRFDFANFWGVAMCTHDPRAAFMNAASVVKPGGAMYLMVYAPEGMHALPYVNAQRKHFASLTTVAQRLAYVETLHHRRWDPATPLRVNLTNQILRALRRPKDAKIGLLDMLEPTFNWVIPLDTVREWFKDAGFVKVTYLNDRAEERCGYHFLGIKATA